MRGTAPSRAWPRRLTGSGRVRSKPIDDVQLKRQVKDHWEAETCGTRYTDAPEDRARLLRDTEEARYRLEPEILAFADFEVFVGKRVLEIGVGGGVDHLSWYRAGADAYGIDLTEAAIDLTATRLAAHGFTPGPHRLRTGDAEALDFEADSFDLVYSWGVLHHTPGTQRALSEACRVLSPGGEARILIYHHPSVTAVMLWLLYGLRRGRLRYPLRQVVYDHLESPGTKAYTRSEAEVMCRAAGFSSVEVSSALSAGDLLEINLNQDRFSGRAYRLLQLLYPRWLIRRVGARWGLNLMIRATK